MLVRGAEPMENRQRREPSFWYVLSLLSVYRTSCTVRFFCSPQPNARAERVSERGSSIYPVWHFLLTRLCFSLHLLYVAAVRRTSAVLHSKPVYTPLALRDWFRAAPRNPLKALTRLRLVQPRAAREAFPARPGVIRRPVCQRNGTRCSPCG